MNAQEKYDTIVAHLTLGHTVQFETYARVVRLTKKHISCVKVSGNSLYVQRGKNWDCVDFCSIRVFEAPRRK